MTIFNNREIATLLWILIILVCLAFNSTARKFLRDITKTLFNNTFIKLFIVSIFYVILAIVGLSEVGIWDLSFLKETVMWYLMVALPSLAHAIEYKQGKQVISTLVTDNLKLIVILEFIIGFFPMSLVSEFFLIPVVTFFLIVAEFSKDIRVKKVFDTLLSVTGMILVFMALIQFVSHFGQFASYDTLIGFSLPPLLSILFLPFCYLFFIYVKYEDSFRRLNCYIENEKIRNFAKLQSMIGFNFRINQLNDWLKTLAWIKVETKADITRSILVLKKHFKLMRNPPIVDISLGWSPYLAMNYLSEFGLSTSLYHETVGDDYYANSDYQHIGEGYPRNTVSYSISGDESTVTKLKVTLDVNAPDREIESITHMNKIMETLTNKCNLKPVSTNESKIIIKEGSSTRFEHAALTLRRESLRL